MAIEPEFLDDVVGTEEPAGLNLAKYWAAAVKRWRLIALSIGIMLTAALLYSILSRPLYKATVVLDVEPDRPNPLDIGTTPIYANVGPEFLATQMQLMQTREIAERVVKRLNLVENRDFYSPRKSVTGRERKPNADEELARVAGDVERSLEAKPVRQIGVTTRDTNLVELSAIASTPRLAADIANTVADAYIAWNLESKYGVAGRASGYLATQIDQTRRELEAKNQELLAYGKQKEIVSPNDAGANVYAQKLEFNYDAAVADRVAKEARYRDLQNARGDSAADTLSNGLVSQLRGEQARLEREYAEKLNLFKPEWPAMRQLKAQIDAGREHLNSVMAETVTKAREAARNDYLSALRREESLKASMRSQQSEAMKFNSDVAEYNNLKLEVDAKRALLNTLLGRQAEVEVMSRLGKERESNIRVAEKARPPGHAFRPSYRRNLTLALLLGGGIGVGLALLLEQLDRSLRTPEQVEQQMQLPALGVIPAVGSGVAKAYGYGRRLLGKKLRGSAEESASIELLPHLNPRSMIAEKYRAFRAALLLSRAGGLKSILITSSFSREGKTATAVNLAVVLAQLGKRVLLVDADLHRPRLHEVFRISNRAGLVSLLAENVGPERLIVKTEVPGVFVLPSGPPSPNPSGLLSSDAMANFLELARMNYDYVVLDAPPVAAVADALVLGNQTDGVVLCVHGGKTPREHVARSRDRLLRSNVRILGILINNLVETGTGYGSADYDAYYGEPSGPDKEERAASLARTL